MIYIYMPDFSFLFVFFNFLFFLLLGLLGIGGKMGEVGRCCYVTVIVLYFQFIFVQLMDRCSLFVSLVQIFFSWSK